MKLSGFRKQIVLFISCLAILFLGLVIGVHNINIIDEKESDFWAQKRVEYSGLLPEVTKGNYEGISDPFFISKRNNREQSVTVFYVHDTNVVSRNSIIAVDILFQNETTYFSNEFESGQAGSLTYLINDSDEEAFVTFLFDLSDHKSDRQKKTFEVCFTPILVATITVVLLLFINLITLRKNLYRPIEQISSLAKNISHGDYNQTFLEVNNHRNDNDEMYNLVYSFELMRDELKAKEETEHRLRQSEKELISCMSHDLQTPLATIKAYGEGIRDGVAATEEEKNKFLGVMLTKTNTMIDMIHDLLTYSNAQLGQLPMEYFDIMSMEFFYPLMEELKNYALQKKVDFQYSLDDTNVFLHMDPKRMTQVMYNLVENAMKYMDKEEKKIEISIKRAGDYLHIKVRDNGMGIKAEEILYIFDKFYRAEKSRTSTVPGSGLGLSICKYIMKEHGGDIWCESKLGEGSVFYLTMPIDK